MPAELYGPAGALVALAFVIAALMRGDLVPGYIYRAERDQRQKAETQAERNADALAALAKVAANGAPSNAGAPSA
jgi:uncharacterized protein (DUF58 family)